MDKYLKFDDKNEDDGHCIHNHLSFTMPRFEISG